MRTAKKIGLGIVIGVGGFFAIGIGGVVLWQQFYPEDYAVYKEEQEQQEKLEREFRLLSEEMARSAELVKNAKEDSEKKLREYQDVVDKNGILKYRPYWAVSDTYKEWEMSGRIITSNECLALVQGINYGHDPDVQQVLEESWVTSCIKK